MGDIFEEIEGSKAMAKWMPLHKYDEGTEVDVNLNQVTYITREVYGSRLYLCGGQPLQVTEKPHEIIHPSERQRPRKDLSLVEAIVLIVFGLALLPWLADIL